jgi:hypothetical protein
MIKKVNKHSLIAFATVLLSFNVCVAQQHTAKSETDSNSIFIGDHLNVRIIFSSSDNTPVVFPYCCDTCIPGIEIVRRSAIDTVINAAGRELRQQWTITSFDSGSYIIPSMSFYGSDSLLLAQTEPLLLTVRTIAVDTTLSIKDIKEPLSAPLTIREVLPYILITLLIFGVIVGSIFAIQYLKNRKKPKTVSGAKKPLLPAHIIAMRELDRLWQKKLCQSGLVKQHYSELSDIVRTYIENRWDIAAMEMVSSEIITALAPLHLSEEAIRKLEQTFYWSDMVKFAKANPLPDENSTTYHNIVDFVQMTKQEQESRETTAK